MTLAIREGLLSDLADLTEIYNHFVRKTAITFDVEPFSIAERREWFNHFGDRGPNRLLVAVSSGKILGYASSSPFRTKQAYETSIEVTVYLSPKSTGKGIGSALYSELFERLEEEDLHRAYAAISLPNPESIVLHKKFGFESVGKFYEVGRKFDTYYDIEWFEKGL